MTLPVPNLDDRRWSDLVDEGRALIPAYSPDWTDHNLHDPGITFIELLAWVAEQDIFRLNRIGDEHRRRFLALADERQRSPQPARTIVTFAEKHYHNRSLHGVRVPKQTELMATGIDGDKIPFQTLDDVTIVSTRLKSIFARASTGTRDLTEQTLERDAPFLPFGDDPQAGSAVYFGLDPIPDKESAVDLRIYFVVDDDPCPPRIDHCAGGQQQIGDANDPQRSGAPCSGADDSGLSTDQSSHHSASVQWECFAGHGQPDSPWQPATVVEDTTAALSRSGFVVLRISPSDFTSTRLARNSNQLHYLRCRLTVARYDSAPEILSVHCNAVEAEQSIRSGALARSSWMVGSEAAPSSHQPGSVADSCSELQAAAQRAREQARHCLLNAATFDSGGLTLWGIDDRFDVFHWQRTANADDRLRIDSDLVELGVGDGRPLQQLRLPKAPVACGSLRLIVLEPRPLRWSQWEAQRDLLSSSRTDRHFTLDQQTGGIGFGDGERGRVVPDGALILGIWKATQAAAGNLPADSVDRFVESERNRWRLPDFDRLLHYGVVEQPLAATGGADAESISDAQSRAFRQAKRSSRAVNLGDYERLATECPGACVARAKAFANVHPAFPCTDASGVVTLVVLPRLPATRPSPSAGLLRRIKRHVYPRRMVGTRVEVVGPKYAPLSVQAQVRARQDADVSSLARRIGDAIDAFLHPLHGGPQQTGWPFGRDVYRSEILHVIDQTPGVDHVLSLTFLDDQGRQTCGNVCVPQLGLVDAQTHQIDVERWEP